MLRTAFGTLEALVERNALTTRTIARNTAGRQFWAKRTPGNPTTRLPWHQRARLSQLSQATPTKSAVSKGLPRATPRTQLKNSFFTPRRNFRSSKARRGDSESAKNGAKPAESLSLRERLKKLSREYGWTAMGIYLALSVLDFPFCFLLVRTVGTEKIAHIEEIVVSNAKKVIPERVQNRWNEYRKSLKEAKQGLTGQTEAELVGHGVAEAEEANKGEGASLATQLALAYAIHKSFIFFRIPLTAAITPKIVKTLRGWGWQIGKRPVRPHKKSLD
ncbi:hypothetical protein B0T21DRAFT_281951 [Apiosordaria backusii]|uniref:DUF1279 domain-containing protein n=1 Tax=Apiosordaria backusii TaxID=314023 RepID=A0AA40ETU4_9PEZI|nr:hypothetical protein B0T21DRAFT_281951 [Apiosordaria backusii]